MTVGDVTSGSVVINWRPILCIEHNGKITNYTVVFQKEGGTMIPGDVNVTNRTFTANGLTPHTNYTFRVAGVNINGTGPHSNVTLITTAEDSGLHIILSLLSRDLWKIHSLWY